MLFCLGEIARGYFPRDIIHFSSPKPNNYPEKACSPADHLRGGPTHLDIMFSRFHREKDKDSRTSSTKTAGSTSSRTSTPHSGTPLAGSKQDLLLFRSPSSDSGCSDVYLQRRAYENVEFPAPPPGTAGAAATAPGLTFVAPPRAPPLPLSERPLPPDLPPSPTEGSDGGQSCGSSTTTSCCGTEHLCLTAPLPTHHLTHHHQTNHHHHNHQHQTSNLSSPSSVLSQEMVGVESFIDFVKKRDLGRVKFAIRENNYDLDTQDEVSPSFVILLSLQNCHAA